MVYYEGHGGSY